jgi:hypothetical protein
MLFYGMPSRWGEISVVDYKPELGTVPIFVSTKKGLPLFTANNTRCVSIDKKILISPRMYDHRQRGAISRPFEGPRKYRLHAMSGTKPVVHIIAMAKPVTHKIRAQAKPVTCIILFFRPCPNT